MVVRLPTPQLFLYWLQGESLALQDTVHRLMDKLSSAGVGSRPIVFVAHSMGGIIVKELLMQVGLRCAARGCCQHGRYTNTCMAV